MRTESTAAQHHSPAVTDALSPQSPWRITGVEVLPEFRLRVAFADGLTGVVDMSGLVRSPRAGVFAPLADASLFAQVRLEYGAVTWPGNLDLAPDAMHDAIQSHGEWRL